MKYITDSLHVTVVGFVPSHWYEDCMGGLAYLTNTGVKSYANQLTIDITHEKALPVPQNAFTNLLNLKLNDIGISCYYLGGGHTADNIVVWILSEKILFAGCMAKDIHLTGLGNLADAVVNERRPTIEKLIAKFPATKIVIPCHGLVGGIDISLHIKDLLSK
ncbi:MAG: hypothetical protein LBL90_03660 [Prevotellaceae bacterium]|jgi:metallo-beta-lactamase class B|nr:hypothetical protein [Prevotellaceae bacterium]